MRKLRSVITGLFLTGFLLSVFLLAIGNDLMASGVGTTVAASGQEVTVTLSAAQQTISYDTREPGHPTFVLPLLYLHRQREATAAADRTLFIDIAGLTGSTEIEVEVVSRHVDVSTGNRRSEATHFGLPDRSCTSDSPCTLEWTFDPATTRSDLYDLRVKDTAGHLLWESPYDRPDLAMLDSWDVGIDGHTVRVTYATLFPFAKGQNDLGNRLQPDAVIDFIEHQFVPMIVDTWQIQFHSWGFGPIHPDWDADQVVEVIVTDPPFALFDGTGSYTRIIGADGLPYPERRIWWPSSNNAFQVYDSLENGCRVTFAHEFFHLVQWNIQVSSGHPKSFWLHVFTEGQGKFAPSVQYPELEIHRSHVIVAESAYASAANRFLALRSNTSYEVLETDRDGKYDATLYWRFLYEQFGSMDIIRAALEEMADHYSTEGIVGSMERTMDAAFARFDGPFHTYEESLIAFARANYALHLVNGRCATTNLTGCGGFYYDPDNTYGEPPIEAEVGYDGSQLTYAGAIPASYGMDFVEVSLDPSANGQPVTIRVQGEGGTARFDVQIWKLGRWGAKPRAITPYPDTAPQDSGGTHVYAIPDLETTAWDRLAIIVTRLDAGETVEPAGNYRITLESGMGTDGAGAR